MDMRKLALFSMLLLPLAVLAQKQYVLPTVECPNDSLAEGQRIHQQIRLIRLLSSMTWAIYGQYNVVNPVIPE